MNFLGHLYFSDNDVQLMYANLLGDFVKGSDYSHFPVSVQKGIRLHRTIDNFIDTHPSVVELLHELYEPLPKIAGIAVDLYFDHLLAKQWDNFHSKSLRSFVDAFYTTEPKHADLFPEEFQYMLGKMQEFDWLYQYQSHEGLTHACIGLSNRISFQNELHNAPDVFLLKEQQIESTFKTFMSDAIPFFENYFKNI